MRNYSRFFESVINLCLSVAHLRIGVSSDSRHKTYCNSVS